VSTEPAAGDPTLWTLEPKVKEAELLDSCESEKPTWEKGSWRGLAEDLSTIIRITAHRFKMPLESGHLMMFVYSQNECWDARRRLQ
jgi:hypothetical protein